MDNKALIILGVAAAGGGVAYYFWDKKKKEEAAAALAEQVVTPPVPGMQLGIPQAVSMADMKKAGLNELIVKLQQIAQVGIASAPTQAKKNAIFFKAAGLVKYVNDQRAALLKLDLAQIQAVGKLQIAALEAFIRQQVGSPLTSGVQSALKALG